MKPLKSFEIRLNLIDLVTEYVMGLSPDPTKDEDLAPFLKLLGIYREDTVRLRNGQRGSLDYLADNLKVGVRIASTLINEVFETNSQFLSGWFYGAESTNRVQAMYSLLCETSFELTKSIMEIESHHPQYQPMFDQERADHKRIHAQWNLEDKEEAVEYEQ